MENHLIHILLVLIPFLGGLLLFVRNLISKQGFRRSGIRILASVVLLMFITVHVSPLGNIFAYHHQSIDAERHHCCMPQVVDGVVEFSLIYVVQSVHQEKKVDITIDYDADLYSINNRSPPRL